MHRAQQQQQPPPPPPQPQRQSLQWFTGAPFTKVAIAFSVVLYILIHHHNPSSSSSSSHNKQEIINALQFDSAALIGGNNNSKHDYYRYVTSKWTYASAGEVIEGVALQLFLYRKYEREMGTRKFIVFVLLVVALGIVQERFLIELVLSHNRVYADKNRTVRWAYEGPYGVVGATFYLFHCYAPRLYPRFVSILGLQFSEKSFYYPWFVHLIASHGWNTVVPTMTGMCAAALYTRLDALQSLVIPSSIVHAVEPIFDRLGLSERPTPMMMLAARGHAAAAAQPRPGADVDHFASQQQQAPEQQIPMPEPDPAAVEQLTSMGFPRQQVMDALRETHNNVEHAANRLLGGAAS
jgi:membrane associated rhomboid family serine protease